MYRATREDYVGPSGNGLQATAYAYVYLDSETEIETDETNVEPYITNYDNTKRSAAIY